MRRPAEANACIEGPAEASGHSPAEGSGRRRAVMKRETCAALLSVSLALFLSAACSC